MYSLCLFDQTTFWYQLQFTSKNIQVKTPKVYHFKTNNRIYLNRIVSYYSLGFQEKRFNISSNNYLIVALQHCSIDFGFFWSINDWLVKSVWISNPGRRTDKKRPETFNLPKLLCNSYRLYKPIEVVHCCQYCI